MDYLAKPVRRERLPQALAKKQRLIAQQIRQTAITAECPWATKLLIRMGSHRAHCAARVLYFKAEQSA